LTSGLVDSLKKTSTRYSINMLVRIILLPSTLTSIPDDRVSFYSLAIKLLQELKNTGVILVDNEDCIKTTLAQRVHQWPIKFRKPAQVLLEELAKKNRIVQVPVNSEIQSTCSNEPCQQCIRIAKSYLPLAVLARQDCNQCAERQLAEVATVQVVDVDEYTLNDKFCTQLELRDRLLDKGEWTKQEFEKEILIPLLRDAKDVKIYDRYIGRSILAKNTAEYQLTLEWMIDVFLRERGSKSKGVFEVYGGVRKFSNSKDQIFIAVSKLRSLESELQKKHPNFRLIIKKETSKVEMPHDRFLITNQVAISIGRGFNLLFGSSPRLVKDVTIAYCSEPGKIEQAVRTLPNL
jgi:hypothetical protein